LAQVLRDIQEVVKSSRISEETFIKVAGDIGQTDSLVQEIQQAMAEQKEGSSQVLEALQSMNDITAQVRDGSREMTTGNQVVLSLNWQFKIRQRGYRSKYYRNGTGNRADREKCKNGIRRSGGYANYHRTPGIRGRPV